MYDDVTWQCVQVVDDAVEAQAARVESALRASTDSRRLGSMAAQAAPKAGAARQGPVRVAEVLWGELEECMNTLHDTAVAVWHLQRVVSKKRDPLTLAAFADAVKVWPTHSTAVSCPL